METEPTPQTVTLNDELFDVVKAERLMPGMVLKSRSHDTYARLGAKQSTLEEQIHTVSLYERGFPVARVLESGAYSDTDWYFIEESLGDKPFHVQFTNEWQTDGKVSDETFTRYASIMKQYIDAQCAVTNRTDISAQNFVDTVVPHNHIDANYMTCGGNVDRYHNALARATNRLQGAPMGVLQLDLNPYNILDRGMIDFELTSYGPIGYDVLLTSLWHRWFTDDTSSKYCTAYMLSDDQLMHIQQLVTDGAKKAGLTDPFTYMQEFLLLKTAWGFSNYKKIDDEDESKRAFYEYRAALLTNAVDSYLAGDPIDALQFPKVRAS